MTDPDAFHVTGYNGEQILAGNSRTFDDYAYELQSSLGINLAKRIFDKAEEKEIVIYDLGAGKGEFAATMRRDLERFAKQESRDISLIDRVQYVGVDLRTASTWSGYESENVRFIQGDIASVLKDPNLPLADIAIAYFVMPYIDDKAEALYSIANKLNPDGVFFGPRCFSHQSVIQDTAETLADFFGDIGRAEQAKNYFRLERKTDAPAQRPAVRLIGTETDFHEYVGKNHLTGFAGQTISIYERL